MPWWKDVPATRAGPSGTTSFRRVGQVAAMRVLARTRRGADAADGSLIAAICPGLIDTDASRPWFEDMAAAQTPTAAGVAPLRARA